MASFEKRSSGWTARFRFIENGKEKNIRLSGFATKKAAQEAVIAYEKEHIQTLSQNDEMTVETLCRAYLRDIAPTLKASTAKMLKSRINHHIINKLGDKKLINLKAIDLLKWQNDLSAQYKRGTVLAIRAALSAVLAYGSQYHDIDVNALKKVRFPKDNEIKGDMLVWAPDEFNRFIKCEENDKFVLFFKTLYYTGMRVGEALALSPSDIVGDIIKVNKSVTRHTGKGWDITTPKTISSIRNIRIPQSLADELHKKKGKFVFGGKAPMSDMTIRFHFDSAIKKAGVPRIRLHDLRHSHASYLISQGCSVVAVSKRLGHKSVKVTLDTYAHFMPEDEDKIIDALTNALGTKMGTK